MNRLSFFWIFILTGIFLGTTILYPMKTPLDHIKQNLMGKRLCSQAYAPILFHYINLAKKQQTMTVEEWYNLKLQQEKEALCHAMNISCKNLQDSKLSPDTIDKLQRSYQSKHTPLTKSQKDRYTKGLKEFGYPLLLGIPLYASYNIQSNAETFLNTMTLNPYYFNQLSSHEQAGIIAHEHQHIINKHTLESYILRHLDLLQEQVNKFIFLYEKEADIKACTTGGIHICEGLIGFIEKDFAREARMLHPKRSFESNNIPQDIVIEITNQELKRDKKHPCSTTRIAYLRKIIAKLKKEQEGYCYNPYYKTNGQPEWFDCKNNFA